MTSWVLLGVLLAGCSPDLRREPTTRPAGTMTEAPDWDPATQSLAVQGTIGSLATVQGARLMRVRGYGLVIGLNGTGSSICPPSIREYVANEIRRTRSVHPEIKPDVTVDQLIKSKDTAVVEVWAEIPAAAVKKRTFDVFLRPVDDETRSLAGGKLMECELKIFQEVTPQHIIEGRTHAKAAGPVFTNPFVSRTATAPASLREAQIIGGGLNLLDRRMSLVTVTPSYAIVKQIEQVINERFGSEPKTADATSPTNVELRVPKAFIGDEKRFIDLVMHLPVQNSPVQREARAKLLSAELGRPEAPLEDVSLSLEGLGTSVIPMIQGLYTEPRREVSYYAARTGLRLRDELALPVMIRHARDTKSPFRMYAIRELGESKVTHRAVSALQDLLGDSDTRVRIAAYESLRKLDPSSMFIRVVGRDPQNFVLDVVPSEGPPVIYVRRSKVRRIALIGGDEMMLQPPLLYSEPGKPVTLSAQADGGAAKIMLREKNGTLGPFTVPLSVPPLVGFLGNNLTRTADGRLEGLGLEYAVVLDILFRLCDSGAINAEMRWEEPSVEDLLGPLMPLGRPESEL